MKKTDDKIWITYPCSTKPIEKRKGYLYHFPRKEFNNYIDALISIHEKNKNQN